MARPSLAQPSLTMTDGMVATTLTNFGVSRLHASQRNLLTPAVMLSRVRCVRHRGASSRQVGRGYAPDPVANIVGHEQRSLPVDGDPDRATQGIAVRVQKPCQYVLRLAYR